MEVNEKQYIKGFNSGYLIAQFQPELYRQLTKGITENSQYGFGLFAGGKQFEKEKMMAKTKSFKNELPSITKNKNIQKER